MVTFPIGDRDRAHQKYGSRLDANGKPAAREDMATALLTELPIDHPALNHEPRPLHGHAALRALGSRNGGRALPIGYRVCAVDSLATPTTRLSIWRGSRRPLRRLPSDPGGEIQVGIDVAGPVAVARCRGAIVKWESWRKQDPRAEVLAFLEPMLKRIEEVNIDSAGIGHDFARSRRRC